MKLLANGWIIFSRICIVCNFLNLKSSRWRSFNGQIVGSWDPFWHRHCMRSIFNNNAFWKRKNSEAISKWTLPSQHWPGTCFRTTKVTSRRQPSKKCRQVLLTLQIYKNFSQIQHSTGFGTKMSGLSTCLILNSLHLPSKRTLRMECQKFRNTTKVHSGWTRQDSRLRLQTLLY